MQTASLASNLRSREDGPGGAVLSPSQPAWRTRPHPWEMDTSPNLHVFEGGLAVLTRMSGKTTPASEWHLLVSLARRPVSPAQGPEGTPWQNTTKASLGVTGGSKVRVERHEEWEPLPELCPWVHNPHKERVFPILLLLQSEERGASSHDF